MYFSRWPRYQRAFWIHLKNESSVPSSWRSDQVFCRKSLPWKLLSNIVLIFGTDHCFIPIAKNSPCHNGWNYIFSQVSFKSALKEDQLCRFLEAELQGSSVKTLTSLLRISSLVYTQEMNASPLRPRPTIFSLCMQILIFLLTILNHRNHFSPLYPLLYIILLDL